MKFLVALLCVVCSAHCASASEQGSSNAPTFFQRMLHTARLLIADSAVPIEPLASPCTDWTPAQMIARISTRLTGAAVDAEGARWALAGAQVVTTYDQMPVIYLRATF